MEISSRLNTKYMHVFFIFLNGTGKKKSLNRCWTVILLFSAFFLKLSGVHSNSLTATVKLKQLTGLERKVIVALENYLERQDYLGQESSHWLKKFLEQAKEVNTLAVEDESFMEKPTNAFLAVRRLAEGWGEVKEKTCADTDDISKYATTFCREFETITRRSRIWPSRDDVISAASAIVRLADFYDLSFEGLANGRIFGIHVLPLSLDDFIYVADVANDQGEDLLATTWYTYTLRQLRENPSPDISKITRVERKLAAIYYRNSMYEKATEIIKAAVKNNPSNKGAQRDMEFFKRKHKGDNSNENRAIPRPVPIMDEKLMSTYQKLCRSQIKTKKQMSKLYCEYRKTSIPLIPSRAEYVNIVPPIVLIHNVVNDREMSHLMNFAKFKLDTSRVGSKDEYSSKVRISESAWIGEANYIISGITRKVELHTGLSAMYNHTNSHAETWQVVNYGLGGMYVPHQDSVRVIREKGFEVNHPALKDSGDRMATFLLYLTDVMAGGATVFPNLKARIPIVKGAAALWYNLYRNGMPDNRLVHAGCPVIIGSKWVSNKWIREIGHAFQLPCALNPDL